MHQHPNYGVQQAVHKREFQDQWVPSEKEEGDLQTRGFNQQDDWREWCGLDLNKETSQDLRVVLHWVSYEAGKWRASEVKCNRRPPWMFKGHSLLMSKTCQWCHATITKANPCYNMLSCASDAEQMGWLPTHYAKYVNLIHHPPPFVEHDKTSKRLRNVHTTQSLIHSLIEKCAIWAKNLETLRVARNYVTGLVILEMYTCNTRSNDLKWL